VLHIREFMSLNIGPETGYNGFSWFPTVRPGKCCNITLN
jgi:hypothetical protein